MSHPHTTATGSMHTYGLAGIELHRVSERRDAELQSDTVAASLRTPSRVSIIRQWLGETLIDTGTRVAGRAAEAQQASRGIVPKVDTV